MKNNYLKTEESEMKRYYLYFYLVDDRVIYIGQTNDPWLRYKQHLSENDLYLKVNKVMLCGFDSRADVDIYETYYIAKLKPQLNKGKKNFEYPCIALNDLCFEENTIQSLKMYYKINSPYKKSKKHKTQQIEHCIFTESQAEIIKKQRIETEQRFLLLENLDFIKKEKEAEISYLEKLKESKEMRNKELDRIFNGSIKLLNGVHEQCNELLKRNEQLKEENRILQRKINPFIKMFFKSQLTSN